MAKSRRRYRRYYKKQPWSSNITDIGPNTFVLDPGEYSATEFTLVTNPAYNNQVGNNIFTVKNVEVAMNFDAAGQQNTSPIENLQFYIMYVPESMAVGTDYAMKHPEYILAMRYYGEPGNDTASNSFYAPAIKIKTRLARKLNTGDRIILFIRGANTSTSTTVNATYGGICRWWTKAN